MDYSAQNPGYSTAAQERAFDRARSNALNEMGGTTPAPPTRDIPAVLNDLIESISHLEGMSERLAKRLDIVRRCYPTPPADDKAQLKSARCAVADTIESQVARVRRVAVLLSVLEDEVQL